MRNKIVIGILIIIGIVLVIIFSHDTSKEEVNADNLESLEVPKKTEEKVTNIMVDIKGAVNKPGVYTVDNSKRVNDVIALAGGLKKDANTNYINLSAKVTDEMVIWIYTKKEIQELKLEQTSTKYMVKQCNCPVVDNTTCLNNTKKEDNSSNDIININTASLEELMTLTGIGEAKAKSIIEYREVNGNFKTIEDIMNVSGIGESAYSKIKDRIKV